MARAYRDEHLVALKQLPHYNPHLGVDALCFQRLSWESSEEDGAAFLAGALITPCALWLVALPIATSAEAPVASDTVDETAGDYVLALPSGEYRLTRHAFGQQAWYQRRILDDLSELGSMQDAARLAQRLMARLMEPAADT
jgi:hypothetical protein